MLTRWSGEGKGGAEAAYWRTGGESRWCFFMVYDDGVVRRCTCEPDDCHDRRCPAGRGARGARRRDSCGDHPDRVGGGGAAPPAGSSSPAARSISATGRPGGAEAPAGRRMIVADSAALIEYFR